MSQGNPQGDASGQVEHTVLTVLRGAERWLTQRGVDAPKRSAELLLGKVLGMDRLRLYLEHDRPMTPDERAAMRELIARRGNGEPVAHLLGCWSFRGLELEVGPAVLVPRPETEELVDVALERLPAPAADSAPLRAIDLGTGSGAIAIALAVERPDLQLVAVDLSQNALAVARNNATGHGVGDRVAFVHGSWWQPVPDDARFVLVVSNPPYIDPARPDGLADDVKRFEPPLALFSASGDPASCYREIAAGLERHLAPGGWFVAETGLGAAELARDVLAAQPFLDAVELLPDLAGAPRFVLARRR
ncbi:MAG: peptide chain release factor N(5)-glutamine methyltransferase [Planctomycetes bacterium]|nr:peptide chain release factor N(5)-glutamine methyltransferase [Planctomycetota bacterium]